MGAYESSVNKCDQEDCVTAIYVSWLSCDCQTSSTTYRGWTSTSNGKGYWGRVLFRNLLHLFDHCTAKRMKMIKLFWCPETQIVGYGDNLASKIDVIFNEVAHPTSAIGRFQTSLSSPTAHPLKRCFFACACFRLRHLFRLLIGRDKKLAANSCKLSKHAYHKVQERRYSYISWHLGRLNLIIDVFKCYVSRLYSHNLCMSTLLSMSSFIASNISKIGRHLGWHFENTF
jgi:hypothetical protein